MADYFKGNKTALRYILLHEFKLHGNATEAHRNIIKAWGEGTISASSCQHWFAKFRSGNTSLEDKEGRGRLPELDDQTLKDLLEEHPRQSEREMAANLGVSVATISRHLQKIGKKRKVRYDMG